MDVFNINTEFGKLLRSPRHRRPTIADLDAFGESLNNPFYKREKPDCELCNDKWIVPGTTEPCICVRYL